MDFMVGFIIGILTTFLFLVMSGLFAQSIICDDEKATKKLIKKMIIEHEKSK